MPARFLLAPYSAGKFRRLPRSRWQATVVPISAAA
jgi:hypothetical protein